MELKKISTVLLLLTVTVFSTACAVRLNEYYDYKQVEIFLQQVSVRARLIGSIVSTEKATKKCSPYKLFISFSLNSANVSSEKAIVSVSDIQLLNVSNNKVAFKTEAPIEKQVEEGSDGVYWTYCEINNIPLEYVRYKLTLRFQVNVNGRISKEDIELYFDEDYKDFKSNDLWDKIMSI